MEDGAVLMLGHVQDKLSLYKCRNYLLHVSSTPLPLSEVSLLSKYQDRSPDVSES